MFRLQFRLHFRRDSEPIMKKAVLLALSLTLAGCYHYDISLPKIGLDMNLRNLLGDDVRMTPEHAMFIESAAVISLLEPQPRVQWVGSNLKESNLESLQIDDWEATSTIVGLMEARLKQKGFTVVGINNDISAKDAYTSSGSFAEPERVRKRLLAAGNARGVDMLVVIYRQQVRDFISDSSQKVTGYGLFKRHSDHDVYAYGVVQVEALNVQKGFVMGKADAEVKVPLDTRAWQENFETDEGPIRLSPVRSDVVREGIIKAISDATMIAAQEAGISN